MSEYVVQWKMRGFEEQTTDVYYSESVALSHARDIQGYQDVEYAIVVSVPAAPETEPKSD